MPNKRFYGNAPPRPMSLRCGCPVDTSAKQKHRPSRQARPPCKRLWQSVSTPPSSLRSRVTAAAIRSLLRGITDSFTLRVQNDGNSVIASTVRCAAIRFSFETPAQAKSIVIRFVLNLRNKKALIPVKHYGDIKAFKFVLSYMCHIA